MENIWSNEWGGKILFSNGESNARGVMILFNKKFHYKINAMEKDAEGRWVKVDIEVEKKLFSIFNIYAPNKDTPGFFHEIENKMRDSEGNIIIMGDFNLALNPTIDRRGSLVNNNKSCEVVKENHE